MNSSDLSAESRAFQTQLPATIEESHQVISTLQKQLEDLSKQVTDLTAELWYQKNKVHQLTQKLWGRSSEKRVIAETNSMTVPLPLVYKDEPVTAPDLVAPETPAVVTEIKSHKRVTRKRNLEAELKDHEGRFPDHLPRKTVVLDDGEGQGEKILVKQLRKALR